jgi:pimeloyl-ACP methyl ester carboxylesterase
MRKTLIFVTTALAIAAAALVPATAAQASTHPMGNNLSLYVHQSRKGWCLSGVDAPVAPAEGAPRSWKVALTLCAPFRFTREVDVLTHGATYTRAYWDWPEGNGLYSYVGRALDDGRATLLYDRIGNGASTRSLPEQPLSSTEITMTSDAFVLHQLIDGLKALGYQRINSIGHSYGSGVVLAEAKKYADVNTMVLTGYLHRPSNPAVTAGNYPANQDAQFQGRSLDNGWLTTRPGGARAAGFHAADSDPVLVANDEARKDLVSLTGLLGFLADRGVAAADNISNATRIPVLVVNGQRDAIFCHQPAVFNCSDEAAVRANEAPFYAKARSFELKMVDSGHDLTLHPSAGASYEAINRWLHR